MSVAYTGPHIADVQDLHFLDGASKDIVGVTVVEVKDMTLSVIKDGVLIAEGCQVHLKRKFSF